MTAPSLQIELGPLRLRNPILTASGTCGYGLEIAPFNRLDRLGGVVVKGLSLDPRPGNPPVRIVETPAGMLNSIGLQNVGVRAFVADILPRLRAERATVIANVFGASPQEYAEVAALLDSAEGVAAVEVNISCPNVRTGGLEIGTDPDATRDVIGRVRGATRLPVIAKLTPNVTDVVLIARAAREAGADAISLINTLVGMSIDTETRRPRLATVTGGLSGPAIRPVALAMVYKVARGVDVPVIGIGGIRTLNDVLEFLIAGASAVEIGTATYLDPSTPGRLVEALETHLVQTGAKNLEDLVGSLVVDDTPPGGNAG